MKRKKKKLPPQNKDVKVHIVPGTDTVFKEKCMRRNQCRIMAKRRNCCNCRDKTQRTGMTHARIYPRLCMTGNEVHKPDTRAQYAESNRSGPWPKASAALNDSSGTTQTSSDAKHKQAKRCSNQSKTNANDSTTIRTESALDSEYRVSAWLISPINDLFVLPLPPPSHLGFASVSPQNHHLSFQALYFHP